MPEIQYARAGDTHVAYQLLGDGGGHEVVLLAGALFPMETLLEDRVSVRFIDGLAALGRLAIFDKRGIGLSDAITDWERSTQEQWAEDVVAVADAAGFERPVLVSWEAMGADRCAAATYPDRFAALVLLSPSQVTRSFKDVLIKTGKSTLPTRTSEEMSFPSRIHDAAFIAWLERSGRVGASPTTAARIWERTLSVEGSLTPPGITTRTLVVHHRGTIVPEAEVRAVADAIPGSTFASVAGADIYPVSGDVDPVLAEIAEFITGAPTMLAPQRRIEAVLFTDLVGSTERAVTEGDGHWSDLLDLHDRTVQRAVAHHGGRVVKYTGDGVLAVMPSATAALDTACEIRRDLSSRSLRIRAGVHVGDVDQRGADVSGLAVNIAARIMAKAEDDQTLVSEGARQATLGSRHRFEPSITTMLKGIPGEWSLWRCVTDSLTE